MNILKIGDFSKKYNVSIDTVRYYIEQQLLLTLKSGCQYSFSQEDCRDMDEIIELKGLGLTINEIQSILSYKRLTSNRTKEYREYLRDILESKKDEFRIEQRKINNTLSFIENKINQLKVDEDKKKALGFPLTMLNYFRCPECYNTLVLLEGTIDSNMVIDGILSCECSYKLKIDEGIVVDRDAIRYKNMPTKKEYYDNTSSKFINFLYNSMNILMKMINSNTINKKYIIEFGTCCGFFMLQYLTYIPKETTYILVDHDIDKITELKNNLELNYSHNNFVFLCCDISKLPLSHGFIDLIIDCFSAEIHKESDGKALANIMMPLLKVEGYIGGIYPYFDERIILENKSIDNYYNKSYIKDVLESQVDTLVAYDNGPINEGGLYNPDVNDNDYYNYIYIGKKTK